MTVDDATPTDVHWRRVVAWAGIPLMIGALNEFALVVALPSVRSEFGLAVTDARWMLLAFIIADALVLVAAGRYGDRVGRQRTAMLGLALIAIGSLICAVAPSFALVIVGRVIEGLGVGVLFSGLLAIIADAVPRESVGRAFGLWALVGAVSVLISPVIGGILADHASWRWILVINAVISLLALLWARRVVPSQPATPAQTSAQRTSLTASPNYLQGTVITALVYAGVALTWLPLVFFLNVVSSLTLTQTGLMFAAYGVWWLVLPPFTGKLADRIGVRRPLLVGLALSLAGLVVLALTAPANGIMLPIVGLSLLGIGVSFTMPAANAATMAHVPPEMRGDASGINMTARMIGSIVGLIVSGALIAGASRDDVVTGAQLSWGIAAAAVVIALVVAAVAIRTPER